MTGTSQGPDEARFEGVISNIHFGATYDGHNTITVDGKRVIFDSGGLQDGAPQVKGRMIGFTFPRDIGSDDYAGLNGRTAEVYCRVFYASGPRMERIPVYSLFGSTRYYVRLK